MILFLGSGPPLVAQAPTYRGGGISSHVEAGQRFPYTRLKAVFGHGGPGAGTSPMQKFERLPADILSRIPHVAEVLLEDSNVFFGYLFGGLATGGVKPLSDVDIAVFVRDTEGLAEYKLDLFDRLAAALGTAELDLVVLNTAPTSLAGRILRHRRVLVDKDPFRRHAYESLTLRKFFDFHLKEEALLARRYGLGR